MNTRDWLGLILLFVILFVFVGITNVRWSEMSLPWKKTARPVETAIESQPEPEEIKRRQSRDLGCLPYLVVGSIVCLGMGFWLSEYSGWAWWLVITGLILGAMAWQDHREREKSARIERLRKECREYPGVWRPGDRYDILREGVLYRDRHRCRECGSSYGVEVHHIIRRSAGGPDSPENLITLCRSCHDSKHPGAREYYIKKSKRTRQR